MTTPLQQINLALDGRIDFLKKTNPWGSGDDDKDQGDLMDKPPDPQGTVTKLLAFVQRHKAQALPTPKATEATEPHG